ncbi:MAG TPA: WecB/TagA/CpsF family glycosyltransferase [Steroidobacteraceae bacterium]|nr:WecB/TagA/CpsF family glycosyltransferase [Steroidobacteraceae bacterium]
MARADIIFITGASRSGTTLLSFVLRHDADVFGLRELQYFGDFWDPRDTQRRFTPAEARNAAATLFAREQHGVLVNRVEAEHRRRAAALVRELGGAAADPAELFLAAVNALAQAAGKTIPCEQTPRYIFYARALLERYPKSHVVHLVRDPRAVMASQKNRWRRRSLAAAGSVPRYETLRVWVNYHPFTVARLWSQATRAALLLRDHPRCTVLRYEDLVTQPEPTVRALCERLGLDFDPRMLQVEQVNSSHESALDGMHTGMRPDAIDRWRRVLTPAETAVTERDCGSLMRQFGYEPVSQRHGPFSDLRLRLSFLGHLGAVLLVNPRRAAVQARALMRSRPPAGSDRPGPPDSTVGGAREATVGDRSAASAAEDGPTLADPDPREMKRFIGLTFWDAPLDAAAGWLVARAQRGQATQVYFVNAHCFNEAAHDKAYAALLAGAPFVFADGVGMAIAARFSGMHLDHNVNGTDLFPLLCEAAARESVPIALLGARPGVAQACAERMQNMFPGLRVAWTGHGYLGEDEEQASLAELNASGARMLFVAKGVPAQERWIAGHAAQLAAPVVLGVGALFDFYSGAVRRAPRVVRELRSEWLYRLMLEPRRLAGRYLLGNPAFIARTLFWRAAGHAPQARRNGGLT